LQNSTETYDGGTHVDYVMNQIIVQLREFFFKEAQGRCETKRIA
jgi:DNA gyrase/topoisomerase IV subunit B